MEKNLKRIIAVILVIVMIIACVGCGETSGDKTQAPNQPTPSATPIKDTEAYDNVGYPISEQTFEKRVSRLLDEYITSEYRMTDEGEYKSNLRLQYKVKDFFKLYRKENDYDIHAYGLFVEIIGYGKNNENVTKFYAFSELTAEFFITFDINKDKDNYDYYMSQYAPIK